LKGGMSEVIASLLGGRKLKKPKGSREIAQISTERADIKIRRHSGLIYGWRESMSFNLHEFSRKLGRREYTRFIIPGAAVSWKPAGGKSFPDQMSPLSDISRGGLSLLTNDPPKVGSELAFLVFPPNDSGSIELLGKVRYSVARGPNLTYKYRVGVELKPFEQSKGCNTLQALSQIESLEQKFGKRKIS
jgi:hypothetical protein